MDILPARHNLFYQEFFQSSISATFCLLSILTWIIQGSTMIIICQSESLQWSLLMTYLCIVSSNDIPMHCFICLLVYISSFSILLHKAIMAGFLVNQNVISKQKRGTPKICTFGKVNWQETSNDWTRTFKVKWQKNHDNWKPWTVSKPLCLLPLRLQLSLIGNIGFAQRLTHLNGRLWQFPKSYKTLFVWP